MKEALLIVSLTIIILLIIILPWVAVQYVNYNEMALLKNKIGGNVLYNENDNVMSMGRYWYGLGYSSILFPSTFIKVEHNDLSVFSKLQIQYSISITLYYRVLPSNLKNIYRTFYDSHASILDKSVISTIKNTMYNHTVNEVITDRNNIINILCNNINNDLKDKYVSITPDKLFITNIDFPPEIDTRFLNNALQLIKNREVELNKNIEQINIDTNIMIEQINANVTMINKIADSDVNKIITDAINLSNKLKFDTLNNGFNNVLKTLNITDTNTIKQLTDLLIITDKIYDMNIIDVSDTKTPIIL